MYYGQIVLRFHNPRNAIPKVADFDRLEGCLGWMWPWYEWETSSFRGPQYSPTLSREHVRIMGTLVSISLRSSWIPYQPSFVDKRSSPLLFPYAKLNVVLLASKTTHPPPPLASLSRVQQRAKWIQAPPLKEVLLMRGRIVNPFNADSQVPSVRLIRSAPIPVHPRHVERALQLAETAWACRRLAPRLPGSCQMPGRRRSHSWRLDECIECSAKLSPLTQPQACGWVLGFSSFFISSRRLRGSVGRRGRFQES